MSINISAYDELLCYALTRPKTLLFQTDLLPNVGKLFDDKVSWIGFCIQAAMLCLHSIMWVCMLYTIVSTVESNFPQFFTFMSVDSFSSMPKKRQRKEGEHF